MSDKNTILERIKTDAPNVRDEQATMTYVPMADVNKPGIVKPDGEQFIVDPDGTLHVQQQYITKIQLVTQKEVTLIKDDDGNIVRDDDGSLKENVSYTLSENDKYDNKGNSIVTVLLSDGTISKFTTNKGDRGLPYLIYTAVLPASAIDADEITLYKANMSRTPVMDDLIFAVFGQSNDEQSYVGILSFTDSEYGNDKILYTACVEFVVETTGKQGTKGDTGAKGDTGVSIESIVFDKTVEGGNQYKITLTDGNTSTFIAPAGPEGKQGVQGDPFTITKTYESIAAMNADFNGTDVKQGQFVIIDTGDVNDPDNAKLYMKDELAWKYITDLSGAIGMVGPQGKPGDTLSIQLGMEGIIQSNRVVFEVQDADSYVYSRKNLQKYLVTMYLPIVGILDNSLPVNITFGDTTYNLYNYLSGSSEVVKIGDLLPVSSYSHETGYFFTCELMFMQNSDYVGFVIIPPTFTAKQLERLIKDNGTVVTDLSEDGTELNIHLSADVVNKLAKVLVQPMAAPGESELVGLTAQGSQENVKLGGTLKKVDDTLDVEENGLHAIRYDVLQDSLTDEQKATARSNIGAGASSFSGSYNDLQHKPKVNTNNTESQTPQNAEELGQELKLHKISKTGKLADAIEDDTHKIVSAADKAKWDTVDSKLDKNDGTGTGTHTFEYVVADGIRLNNMIAGASDVDYFVTADSQGNFKKREVNEVLSDIGGTSVQVGGVMAHDVNLKDDCCIKPIVTETTNDAGVTVKNVEYKFSSEIIIAMPSATMGTLSAEVLNIIKTAMLAEIDTYQRNSPYVILRDQFEHVFRLSTFGNLNNDTAKYAYFIGEYFSTGNSPGRYKITITGYRIDLTNGQWNLLLIDQPYIKPTTGIPSSDLDKSYAELDGTNNFTGYNSFSYDTYISGTNVSLYVQNDVTGTPDDIITLFSAEQSADTANNEETWTNGYPQGRIFLNLRETEGNYNVLKLTITPLGVNFDDDEENSAYLTSRYMSWYDIYRAIQPKYLHIMSIGYFHGTDYMSIGLQYISTFPDKIGQGSGTNKTIFHNDLIAKGFTSASNYFPVNGYWHDSSNVSRQIIGIYAGSIYLFAVYNHAGNSTMPSSTRIDDEGIDDTVISI